MTPVANKTFSLTHLHGILEPSDQSSSSFQSMKGSMPLAAKRGVLPKHATQTMKSWLFQHIVVWCSLRQKAIGHVYPKQCHVLGHVLVKTPYVS